MTVIPRLESSSQQFLKNSLSVQFNSFRDSNEIPYLLVYYACRELIATTNLLMAQPTTSIASCIQKSSGETVHSIECGF